MNAYTPQLQQILRKVRHVELRARRALDSTRTGTFRSVFRGRGLELDQVREYVPGDDVRHIDWNATAREGRPYVKVHIEERELCVVLALDVSPSSEFGTVGSTKREHMAELAAVLAFAALRGNDRVGLVLFSDHVEATLPPGRGRAHVLRIVRTLLTHRSDGVGTAVVPALDLVQRLARRRAAVFLITDLFTEEDEALDLALRRASLRHEVVVVRCTDPLEHSLPDVGLLSLEDAETGDVVELDTSDPEVRDRYAAEAAALDDLLVRRLRRAGVGLLRIQTGTDYVPALAAFMARGGPR